MRKIYSIIVLLLAAFVFNACSSVEKLESLEVKNQSYNLDDFNAISVQEGIDVVLHKSFKNRAEATSNFMEYLSVQVDDEGTLIIELDQPANAKLKKNETSVEVWAENVNRFSASSEGKLKVDGVFEESDQEIYASSKGLVDYDVNCEKLIVETSSNGNVKGNIDVNELNASASSKGEVSLRGVAKYANVQATSSGTIYAKSLDAENVEAKASSKGTIKIGVSDYLKAQVSSSGNLYYKANGTVKLDVEKSSGGDVKEMQGVQGILK